MMIWLLTLIFLVSLSIGSFINVVIYRLPLMMTTYQCSSQLETAFNLVLPHSHCPYCKKTLAWIEKIPLLSYYWLKGQCRYCSHPISKHYSYVEILTAFLAFVCYWRWGLSLQSAATFVFSASLLCLTVIDYQHLHLPDPLTLGLLWLGLIINLFFAWFTLLPDAVLGAIMGYLVLWLVYFMHHKLTGKTGMGHGDFKLLAAIGAWLGWQSLPLVLILASLLGLVYGLYGIFRHHNNWRQPLPFGPFLAISGWSVMLLNSFA